MILLKEKKNDILRGMPDTARVWIYQSSRPFSEMETVVLNSQIKGFVNEWTAHKKTLLADGCIIYNRFVILSVDESLNDASGCSIDASVYFLKSIENQYNVQLFERMNFAYLDGENLKVVPSTEFARLYTEGVLHEDTLVFDNLVKTVKELRTSWIKPLNTSWHRRFV